MTLITQAAMRAGFSGGLVVDYPNSTKAKKYFLCLFAGEMSKERLPEPKRKKSKTAHAKGLGEEEEDGDAMEDEEREQRSEKREEEETNIVAPPSDTIVFSTQPGEGTKTGSKLKKKLARSRGSVKNKAWVRQKKERYRMQGKAVKEDSKYTGRKRSNPKF
eukprot:g24606.t1